MEKDSINGGKAMTKEKNPNREKSFEIFKEHHGLITNKKIAEMLCESERNIKFWKSKDSWNENYNPKGGAPKGNKNAAGKKGGAPLKNQNARTEGWYSKYYPTVVRNLIKEAEEAGGSQLEILWAQIMTQWIAIIRAQEIMFVKDKDDITKELKKTKTQSDMKGPKGNQELVETFREEEYEIQQAWDKQANFLNAQSRAMTTLANLIKRYDEMLHNNWTLATEEQKLRVDRLKVQLKNPELQHRKDHDEKKLQLERERFEHAKEIDGKRYW